MTILLFEMEMAFCLNIKLKGVGILILFMIAKTQNGKNYNFHGMMFD